MYTGDEAERANIARDIAWPVPGHNPVSGDYRGFDEYTQLMPARMAPLTRWDLALDEVMVNGDYVMTTFYLQGERKGRTAEGRVAEGWGFTDDQAALDDFFAA